MVKRSRHRPFTAVTRVRFPMESPNRFQRNPNPRDSFFYNLWMYMRDWRNLSEAPNLWFGCPNLYEAWKQVNKGYARLAELADALDLGSSGRPWGFKSLIAHHVAADFAVFKNRFFQPVFYMRFVAAPFPKKLSLSGDPIMRLVAYDWRDLNPRERCKLLINTDDFTTLTIKIILHKRA